MKKSAEIHPLPGIRWEPKACLNDLLSDVEDIESIFILIHYKDGEVSFRAANHTSNSLLWALQNHIYRMMRDNNPEE